MKGIILLALLPLAVQAQTTFGPVRLDDGTAQSYFYPSVNTVGANQLRCTWASSGERIKAEGQLAALDGTLQGPRLVYEDVIPGQVVCPPELTIAPTADGGEARLLFHS